MGMDKPFLNDEFVNCSPLSLYGDMSSVLLNRSSLDYFDALSRLRSDRGLRVIVSLVFGRHKFVIIALLGLPSSLNYYV